MTDISLLFYIKISFNITIARNWNKEKFNNVKQAHFSQALEHLLCLQFCCKTRKTQKKTRFQAPMQMNPWKRMKCPTILSANFQPPQTIQPNKLPAKHVPTCHKTNKVRKWKRKKNSRVPNFIGTNKFTMHLYHFKREATFCQVKCNEKSPNNFIEIAEKLRRKEQWTRLFPLRSKNKTFGWETNTNTNTNTKTKQKRKENIIWGKNRK